MPITTRTGPSLIQPAEYYECGPEFDVGSWTPGTVEEKKPATQVHLRFGTPPGRCMVVRFKGTGSLDALIDALIEHREYTFGKRKTPWHGTELLAGRAAADMRERAASFHESVNVASDDERHRGSPGAGAMGAVIEYRDGIRRLDVAPSVVAALRQG